MSENLKPCGCRTYKHRQPKNPASVGPQFVHNYRREPDHECVAEAFKTPWNIFLLLYPIGALTGSTIVLPGNVKPAAGSP